MAMSRKEPNTARLRRKLRSILDEEIASLPEKYRAAVVLYYLESKSCRQAARELHCLPATLAKHLARARALLRRSLLMRGFTLPPGIVARTLREMAAVAPVPLLLIYKTVKAAALVAAGKPVSTAYLSARALALAEEALLGMQDDMEDPWSPV